MYETFTEENFKKVVKELDKYKRLIENLKTLDLYEIELDYDWEENSIAQPYCFDMDYYVKNWFECEENDDEK